MRQTIVTRLRIAPRRLETAPGIHASKTVRVDSRLRKSTTDVSSDRTANISMIEATMPSPRIFASTRTAAERLVVMAAEAILKVDARPVTVKKRRVERSIGPEREAAIGPVTW